MFPMVVAARVQLRYIYHTFSKPRGIPLVLSCTSCPVFNRRVRLSSAGGPCRYCCRVMHLVDSAVPATIIVVDWALGRQLVRDRLLPTSPKSVQINVSPLELVCDRQPSNLDGTESQRTSICGLLSTYGMYTRSIVDLRCFHIRYLSHVRDWYRKKRTGLVRLSRRQKLHATWERDGALL